jgi:hypothetical protein
MNVLDLIRTRQPVSTLEEPVPSLENRKELIARYKQLRVVAQQLNLKLVSHLDKSVLDEGAKKLGLLRNGVFFFDSEEQTSILMDYCVHDVIRNGINAPERMLRTAPPPPDSDEMECLQAQLRSTYSLY